ncbi:hypothetical protein SNEBB_008528 [Seison nebaliae]|nr:hypothetical protein SNEBB_008528 [Seison nebaliae]
MQSEVVREICDTKLCKGRTVELFDKIGIGKDRLLISIICHLLTKTKCIVIFIKICGKVDVCRLHEMLLREYGSASEVKRLMDRLRIVECCDEGHCDDIIDNLLPIELMKHSTRRILIVDGLDTLLQSFTNDDCHRKEYVNYPNGIELSFKRKHVVEFYFTKLRLILSVLDRVPGLLITSNRSFRMRSEEEIWRQFIQTKYIVTTGNHYVMNDSDQTNRRYFQLEEMNSSKIFRFT